MAGIPFARRSLADLASRHGGALRRGAGGVVLRLVPVGQAASGDLAPLLAARYVDDAVKAVARGAHLLVDEALASREDVAALPGWFHPYAAWAMAEVLDFADAPADEPVLGPDVVIGAGAILLPRVRLGARVHVAPGAVVGAAGFGFATGPGGVTRAIPQLGGVLVEDDVFIGPLCTIASGTLGPTILRRGVKLDAQVHVAHNVEIGEGSVLAAQCGLAGSAVLGRGVMLGGQVGVADHVHVGDNVRIAAKSGVIGDVPAGATVAGYPAVDRHRWLRGLAEVYRLVSRRGSSPPPSLRTETASPLPSPVRVRPASQAPSAESVARSASVRPEAIIRRTSPIPGPRSDE
jgi:UDP-3-O-[3-hydroxymyristoyl] glucosamine N-acyltransferase